MALGADVAVSAVSVKVALSYKVTPMTSMTIAIARMKPSAAPGCGASEP
jgi:hypothetical protein